MKLKSQILGLGLAGAVAAALVGAIALSAARDMGSSLEDVVHTSELLQASQEADMMHDAIRGDAQAAMLAATKGKSADVDQALKELGEHRSTFEQAFEVLEKGQLEGTAAQALSKAKPQFQAYTAAARRLIEAAQKDATQAASRQAAAEGEADPSAASEEASQAQAELAAFQAAFSALEDSMASLSDEVAAMVQAHIADARQNVSRDTWSVAIAFVVACVALVGIALAATQRIVPPMARAVQAANAMAEGDLTNHLQPEGCDEARNLLIALSSMQEQLGRLVREVKTNAEQVASASMQIAQGNLDLSSRNEQQAAALQQTSATMSELGGNVRANTESAKQAATLAQSASDVASRGGEMMSEVVTNINGINESSRKIADIISVIDGIAFQTNILALNAAVEAARAGEQGRGFAVVAGEVRSLAGRSAEAAREIKALITASVERVEQGTALVGRAGQTMEDIVSAIRRVTALAGEISAASVEQSQGVEEVGRAVGQMDQATQRNTALVEQSASAAESLSQQAKDLVRAVDVFKVA